MSTSAPIEMEKHFVTFYSPGSLVAEESTREIDSWDVPKAQEMAQVITERHGATPYGFRFFTRTRGSRDLDSHVSESSPMYYINCKVETLAEIEARNDPKDKTLISNMRGNDYDKVVVTIIKGWKSTLPFHPDDVVLQS